VNWGSHSTLSPKNLASQFETCQVITLTNFTKGYSIPPNIHHK